MFGSSLPPVVCIRDCIVFLCMFAYNDVKPFAIVHPSRFVVYVIVLCLVYLMLSLDSPMLIVPSVFSNVYVVSMGMPTVC
jgi:hypothetical protein